MRRLGVWNIGKGSVTGGEISAKYGLLCHSSIRRTPVRAILQFPGLRGMLMQAIPPQARTTFDNLVLSDHDDSFRFSLTANGLFSAKSYYKAIGPSSVEKTWGSRIWRPWLPSKISVLIWRIFHKAVPTDENIQRMRISIASKCTCCSSPKEESLLHLFFRSEPAIEFWQKLGNLFDRHSIAGPAGLIQVWFKGRKDDFMDCLATALAACGLWELWKSRNAVRHDTKPRQLWREVLSWANIFSQSIHVPFRYTDYSCLILGSLGVPIPRSQPTTPRWMSWKPPASGYALSIALSAKNNQDIVGGVLRGSHGDFVMACIQSFSASNPLAEFRIFIENFADIARARGKPVSIIQSSHPVILAVTLPEDEITLDEVYIRRALHMALPSARFDKLVPAQNGAATALIHTMNPGTYDNVNDLSLALRRTLIADRYPSNGFQNAPDTTRDDLDVQRPRFPARSAQDDSVT